MLSNYHLTGDIIVKELTVLKECYFQFIIQFWQFLCFDEMTFLNVHNEYSKKTKHGLMREAFW